jgi:phosphoglycolate phosphatase
VKNLIFDLDGTLVDSRQTIHASLNHALGALGHDTVDFDRTSGFIGAPLLDIFTGAFGMNAAQTDEAIEIYRAHYARLNHEGTTVYPRAVETLCLLRDAGYSLYIATVKPGPVARSVLGAKGMLDLFSGISGSSMDSTRKDKTEIIAHSVRKNSLVASRSVMVGDRYHDIQGARQNGMRSIGVSYGYGSGDELIKSGADFVIACLSELPGQVRQWNETPVMQSKTASGGSAL